MSRTPPPDARRLDWHVLLPPRRARERWVLSGGSAALRRLAVSLELADAVAGTPDELDGEAQVVAILMDAPVSIHRAASWVPPGGALYWEIDRRRPRQRLMTPRRARGRLLAAGLDVRSAHWVAPHCERPTRFLPAGGGQPARWFVQTVAGVARPLVRQLTTLLAGSPRLFSALLPTFALVATRPEAPARTPGGDAADVSAATTVVLTGGEEPWARITMLPFDGTEHPTKVVKVPRLPVFARQTAQEQETLATVRTMLPPPHRDTLPQPLASVASRTGRAGVQSYASGRSMFARMHDASLTDACLRDDFRQVVAWAVVTHRATVRERVTVASQGGRREIEDPLRRLVERIGGPEDVRRLIDRLASWRTAASDLVLPVVWNHRDLGPWNVLREGDRLHILDWEVARPGPALADVIYAAMHWTFIRHRVIRETEEQSLRWLLAEAHARDVWWRTLRDEIARYAEEMGVARRAVAPIAVAMLADQALDRDDRLRAIGSPDADPWRDNRYARCLAVLASLPDLWLTQPLVEA